MEQLNTKPNGASQQIHLHTDSVDLEFADLEYIALSDSKGNEDELMHKLVALK